MTMDSTMLERLRVDALASERDGDRAVLIDRFRGMLSRLVEIGESARTPEATRNKARTFLGLVEEAHRRLGDALFQPSYLLNVVGEAFVKARFIAEPIVEFLQVGLYFHGIRQIERRFRSRAAGYLGAHAVLVSSYVSRPSLKALLDEGERRLAEGKVFCLTYHYLNALKAEYFRTLRASQDALDHVEPETALQQFEGPSAARGAVEPSDRVGLMLEIFATRLTATQQKVYLAKNRSSQDAAGFRDVPAFEPFRQLFEGLNDELDGHGNLGWSEIAARLSVNEKTAKREYVRALHILLRETAHAVFGLNITSNYVRRVLEQLRVVVAAKDLRIRSATGDGLPRLVEKWEVALRFVLNHDRALA
jgi:hypothetical protein